MQARIWMATVLLVALAMVLEPVAPTVPPITLRSTVPLTTMVLPLAVAVARLFAPFAVAHALPPTASPPTPSKRRANAATQA